MISSLAIAYNDNRYGHYDTHAQNIQCYIYEYVILYEDHLHVIVNAGYKHTFVTSTYISCDFSGI